MEQIQLNNKRKYQRKKGKHIAIVGAEITRLRNEEGITTIELVEACGVSDASISRYENDLSKPSHRRGE
ncbi:helix-turn-helix domain-containing protein [Paenibacillus oralis]|uniref:Helix-turn-helix domain-containing protein n=1 Tax=Paenibacillus oralis TaxID=2490856 RepID=A0A3P3TC13_9BACL|nr:helix-turn-helix domain-containing protein [Paenibacillus oralis]RRJ54648.1 helix-turn-helix domain-containing protein [Paenibacillus oralis]